MKKGFAIFFLSITIFTASAQVKKSNANTNALPIGVFDSGTGGLTVLNAILSLDYFNNVTGEPKPDGKPDFEKEYFQFLADQANMPYGNYAAENKTDLLKEHILKNVDFLIGKNYSLHTSGNWQSKTKPSVKMLVVACNTATAYALPEMKAYLKTKAGNVPCIGVIDAGSKAALEWQQKNGAGLIGVFATAGTVASDGYPRTIKKFAKALDIKEPVIMSQGGVGLAESIDRDWAYFVDTLNATRKDYKGPSLKNKNYTIDTSLLSAYNFNKSGNKLLCEYDDKGSCLDIQLNDPANYVRYHLVGLLENILKSNIGQQMNTLILGCTHYPFMKDTIRSVLNELYNYQTNGAYRYRNILAAHVELIDPAVETAKEAYLVLRKQKFQNYSRKLPSAFYISVPNTSLPEVELQPDGWFTYQYKYGRIAGAGKAYVKVVPFDNKNISEATYSRFRQVLPRVYTEIANSFSAPASSTLKRNKVKGE
jgi:glutamate racemase